MVIKFAVIGCGRIAPKHIESIKEIKGAKLVAVCDIVEAKAKDFAEKYTCKYYTDYKELLENEKDVDCINVCTPHAIHAEITIVAAKFGKNVVTEKPMATSLEEADEMIKTCKENNVKLFVIKQNRYNEPIIKLKEALDKGRFGKLFYGNTTVYWTRPQDYYDQDPWRGTKEHDDGVLMNQSSHHIDMLRWLMGEVEDVHAFTETQTHNIEAEDMGIAVLKFKNGAVGTIVATTSVFPHNLEGSVTIMGADGSVKVGGTALNKMEFWHFKDWTNDDEIIAKTSENPPNVYGFGHQKYLKEVVNCIENNLPPSIGGEEGRKTLALIQKIKEVAKLNKENECPNC